MDLTNYAERNREAWNQVTPIHQQQRKNDLNAAVPAATFSVLDPIERSLLEKLDVKQKTVAHLCCNNGVELISVLKLGATAGVGFDIADAAIEEATQLGTLSKTNCAFVRTNIYAIDPVYFDRFDLVYITIGALCWFDDLARLFSIAAQLLRPNGHLFIYEAHPTLNMFALPGEEAYADEQPLQLAYSYFRRDPFIDTNGLDYVGKTQYAAKTTYAFPHTLADIFSGILKSKLAIREFQEYAHDISADFKHLEQYQKLPMCYTLVAQK